MEKIIVTNKTIKRTIIKLILERGPDCDLNDVDTSRVTDMSDLFCKYNFNGDISKWNTSNVTDMSWMFFGSKFNRDISNWNVSKVEDMSHVFEDSKFNQDISNWDVSNVTNMKYMFSESKTVYEYLPKIVQQRLELHNLEIGSEYDDKIIVSIDFDKHILNLIDEDGDYYKITEDVGFTKDKKQFFIYN